MLHSLGRFCQLAGLFILPIVVILEMQGALGFRNMLAGFLFGVALFYIGRTLLGDPRV
ncbi:MAG: hypothetical protein WD045_16070 [Pirellulaceae bacterium]